MLCLAIIYNISRLHAEIITGFSVCVYFYVKFTKVFHKASLHWIQCHIWFSYQNTLRIYSLFDLKHTYICWYTCAIVLKNTSTLQPYLCMMYTRPNILEQFWLSVNPWSKKSVTWIAKNIKWLGLYEHFIWKYCNIAWPICSTSHSALFSTVEQCLLQADREMDDMNDDIPRFKYTMTIRFGTGLYNGNCYILHTNLQQWVTHASEYVCVSSEYVCVSSANSRLHIRCFIPVIWHWKTNTLKNKTHLCVLWLN